jgi:thioredoxin-like negative regulator of GroEL
MELNHYNIIDVNQLEQFIDSHKGIIIFRFWKPGCPACIRVDTKWHNEVMSRRKNKNCLFLSINVEDNMVLTRAFQITHVPTFIRFNNSSCGCSRSFSKYEGSEWETIMNTIMK